MPGRIQKRKWNGKRSKKTFTKFGNRSLRRAGLAHAGYSKMNKGKRRFPKFVKRTKRGRRATESSTITGSSKIASYPLELVCRVWDNPNNAWIYFNSVSGEVVTAETAKMMTHIGINAKPVESWNLMQRQSMYKKFRMTGVDYKLFSDSVAAQKGNGLAMATYADPCDKTHCLLLKNWQKHEVPDIPLLEDVFHIQERRKFLLWLSNQSGQKRMKFGGSSPLNMHWRMKPLVSQELELFPQQGAEMISTKVTRRFPWMDFERDLNKEMALGHCDLYFPILEIMPLIPGTDVSSKEMRKFLVMPYQPLLQITMHWQCKGKWIDADYVDAFMEAQTRHQEQEFLDMVRGQMPKDEEPTQDYKDYQEMEDLTEKMESLMIISD